jgi:hypothetical protein
MEVDNPPSPPEFQSEHILVFDEANHIFVPIPAGFVAPSRSAFDDQNEPEPERWSTPSGTDFEETREATLRARKRKRELGRDHSDTEREDIEDDEELRSDVVEETSPSPRPPRRKKKARKGRGKGKRRAPATSDEGEHTEDEEVARKGRDKGNGRMPAISDEGEHAEDEEVAEV